MNSFVHWLGSQTHRDDAIGDLVLNRLWGRRRPAGCDSPRRARPNAGSPRLPTVLARTDQTAAECRAKVPTNVIPVPRAKREAASSRKQVDEE